MIILGTVLIVGIITWFLWAIFDIRQEFDDRDNFDDNMPLGI